MNHLLLLFIIGTWKSFGEHPKPSLLRNGHTSITILVMRISLWYTSWVSWALWLKLFIIITINNILGTSVVGTIAYVSTNLVFGIIDLNASPQIIKKYKIQDTKNFPVRIPVHVYSFAYCFNFYPFLTGWSS